MLLEGKVMFTFQGYNDRKRTEREIKKKREAANDALLRYWRKLEDIEHKHMELNF